MLVKLHTLYLLVIIFTNNLWEVHGVYTKVFMLWLVLERQLGWTRGILRKKKEDKTGFLEQGTRKLRLESLVEDIDGMWN